MDAKKLAMVLAILALLPVFVVLFVDAIYAEPKYEDFCNSSRYYYPEKVGVNCTAMAYDARVDQCYRDGGFAEFKYDEDGCQLGFDSCNYCGKEHNEATSKYNRNVFFIILPVGLVIVLIGIYLTIDYIGAGLMFAGLITMFYATLRYFSELSKLGRALIILAELLLIMWIGYRKISGKEDKPTRKSKARKRK
ncbi:MAG TPA: hypothetical protein VEC16_00645 [Alphaproteobacteria bacterium]|nr:hypothetical protein [Alphaproteobacteria bacterium]